MPLRFSRKPLLVPAVARAHQNRFGSGRSARADVRALVAHHDTFFQVEPEIPRGSPQEPGLGFAASTPASRAVGANVNRVQANAAPPEPPAQGLVNAPQVGG